MGMMGNTQVATHGLEDHGEQESMVRMDMDDLVEQDDTHLTQTITDTMVMDTHGELKGYRAAGHHLGRCL